MITIALIILIVLIVGKNMSWLYPRIKGNNLMLTAQDPQQELPAAGSHGRLLVFSSSITEGHSSKDYSFIDAIEAEGFATQRVISENDAVSEYLSEYQKLAKTDDYEAILLELPFSGEAEAATEASLAELLAEVQGDLDVPMILFSVIRTEVDDPAYDKLIEATWALKSSYDLTFIDLWNNRELQVEAKSKMSYMLDGTRPTIAGQQALYLPRLQPALREILALADMEEYELQPEELPV